MILGAIGLFALWLLMSGVYKPLVIWLGAGSAIFAAYMVHRMERASEGAQVRYWLRPVAALGYLVWLFKEIAKSNWAVTKAIMSPEMPVNRHCFRTPFSQKTEIGQVVFANSITLTPGTITVEIWDKDFYVHALQYDETTPDSLAEMDRRASAIEVA